MRAIALDTAGRRVLLDAAERHGASREARGLLQPVAGEAPETPAEAADFIGQIASSFAAIDRGLIAIDHRAHEHLRRVLALALGPAGAFIVSGDGERVLLSQQIPLWALASEIALDIGWREASHAPPPSTATTAPVITALQALAGAGLAEGMPIDVAEARLDELLPGRGAELLGFMAQDELVTVDGGTVAVGVAASAPGLEGAMSGRRLEFVSFDLPAEKGERPQDGIRLSFLGPSGERHAVLRDAESSDVTLARLDSGELLTLLATLLAGREQPLSLPVGEDEAADVAPCAIESAFTSVLARDLATHPIGRVLLRPNAVLEITGEGGDALGRMGVSIAGDVAVAWTWRRSEARVRVVDEANLPQALADTLAEGGRGFFGPQQPRELFVDARRREGGDLLAVTARVDVPGHEPLGAQAIAEALEAAGWR